jgi:predicted amidophosphoribosyltransferase
MTDRNSEWPCPKCGRQNAHEHDRCLVCRTRNPRRVRTKVDRDRHRARMRGFKEGHGR